MKQKNRLIRHWVAILLLGGSLSVGALSFIRAVETVGDPFAGFFFGPNLLVGIAQREEWPGIQNGLRSLDRIVAVDGAAVSRSGELLERVEKRKPGEKIVYRILRNGETRDVAVPVARYTLGDFAIVFLAPFIIGLLFTAFGGILYFSQPNARGSLLYLMLCSVIGVFCMAVYESYTTFTFFRLITVYPIIGALSVHLFSLFPESPASRFRVRAGVVGVYLLGAALVVLRELSLYDPVGSAFLSKISSLYVLIVLVADLFFLARAYLRAPNQALKDKIKIITVGLFIASSAIAVWSLNFLLVTRSFYLDEGILLAAVFPLFMGYAILRKNIFELDRVIRLSLINGVAGALVFAFYAAILGGVREIFPQAGSGRYFGWLMVFLVAVGALLFNKLRRRVNDAVYPMLFRRQFDLEKGLLALDRSLVAGLGSAQIADRVGGRLVELLDAERCAVFCFPPHVSGKAVVRTLRWDDPPVFEKIIALFETEGLLDELRKRAAPVETARISSESPDRFRQSVATLRSHRIEVLLPCVSSDTLLGLVFLGSKLSRDRYEVSDLQFLRPVAARMGIVLENAGLTAEADRQARLVALGQMASVLIHDIKNPLSTIRISAGSLKRRFREGDHAHELTTFIEEEVDRMDRTVQGILTYAKPGGLSLSSCSVNALVSNVTERSRAMFEKAEVRLDVQLTAGEAPVEADEGRLGRAIENLLVNAREATSRGGVVTVKTFSEAKGDGRALMWVVVEDRGCGMDAATRDQVFKPFFTTKPAGTGLGLAIVKQIVTEHGGEVELESKPGGGTRFMLQLPSAGNAGK